MLAVQSDYLASGAAAGGAASAGGADVSVGLVAGAAPSGAGAAGVEFDGVGVDAGSAQPTNAMPNNANSAYFFMFILQTLKLCIVLPASTTPPQAPRGKSPLEVEIFPLAENFCWSLGIAALKLESRRYTQDITGLCLSCESQIGLMANSIEAMLDASITEIAWQACSPYPMARSIWRLPIHRSISDTSTMSTMIAGVRQILGMDPAMDFRSPSRAQEHRYILAGHRR